MYTYTLVRNVVFQLYHIWFGLRILPDESVELQLAEGLTGQIMTRVYVNFSLPIHSEFKNIIEVIFKRSERLFFFNKMYLAYVEKVLTFDNTF